MIAVGIMVSLDIATSVEIPMSFLGINLVRSVAPAVCHRYGTGLPEITVMFGYLFKVCCMNFNN